MAENIQVVLVEDDALIAQSIGDFLQKRCFDVKHFDRAYGVLEYLKDHRCDVVILDLCLPDQYGMELCRAIKADYRLPVVIVSAESGDEVRIAGLQTGADDYIEKPFNMHELYLKLNKLTKLYGGEFKETIKRPAQVQFSGWTFDYTRNQLLDSEGVEIMLTQTELNLLKLLLDHVNQVLSRDQVADELGMETNSRSVDVHVARLRDKLDNPQLIKTIRSHGYVFVGKLKVISQ